MEEQMMALIIKQNEKIMSQKEKIQKLEEEIKILRQHLGLDKENVFSCAVTGLKFKRILKTPAVYEEVHVPENPSTLVRQTNESHIDFSYYIEHEKMLSNFERDLTDS